MFKVSIQVEVYHLEDRNGNLSEDQLMWLPSRTGECHPFGTAAVLIRMCHFTCIGTRSSQPTMEDQMNDVAAVVPAKWRFVGIQL